jgi:hypothetical protein
MYLIDELRSLTSKELPSPIVEILIERGKKNLQALREVK